MEKKKFQDIDWEVFSKRKISMNWLSFVGFVVYVYKEDGKNIDYEVEIPTNFKDAISNYIESKRFDD